MKIKCIKAGNISFGGNVLSVVVGQEFPGDETFVGLVDLYVDMFEKVEDKVETKVKEKEVKSEPVETKEVKSETHTEKAKKLFTK